MKTTDVMTIEEIKELLIKVDEVITPILKEHHDEYHPTVRLGATVIYYALLRANELTPDHEQKEFMEFCYMTDENGYNRSYYSETSSRDKHITITYQATKESDPPGDPDMYHEEYETYIPNPNHEPIALLMEPKDSTFEEFTGFLEGQIARLEDRKDMEDQS